MRASTGALEGRGLSGTEGDAGGTNVRAPDSRGKMHRLFGKPKAKEPPTPAPTLGEANTKMNQRLADMDSQIKSLDDELLRYKTQLAKISGPSAQTVKNRALQTLRRKKTIEAQRDQLMAQVMNVERTVFAIETAKDTQVTVSAMKEATKQLKVEHEKISISEIEDMQDDLEELFEDQEEIQEILGRSYGIPDGLDEADLEAELAGLEEQLESAALDEPTPTSAAPTILSPASTTTALPNLGGLSLLPTSQVRGDASENDPAALRA